MARYAGSGLAKALAVGNAGTTGRLEWFCDSFLPNAPCVNRLYFDKLSTNGWGAAHAFPVGCRPVLSQWGTAPCFPSGVLPMLSQWGAAHAFPNEEELRRCPNRSVLV